MLEMLAPSIIYISASSWLWKILLWIFSLKLCSKWVDQKWFKLHKAKAACIKHRCHSTTSPNQEFLLWTAVRCIIFSYFVTVLVWNSSFATCLSWKKTSIHFSSPPVIAGYLRTISLKWLERHTELAIIHFTRGPYKHKASFSEMCIGWYDQFESVTTTAAVAGSDQVWSGLLLGFIFPS